MNRRDRENLDRHIMLGSDRNAVEQACYGCQQPLLLENAWMEDGCPCNTRAGVNNLNLYRWKLLHDLQQAQSHKLEAAQKRIEELEATIAWATGNFTPEQVARLKEIAGEPKIAGEPRAEVCT